MAVEDVPVVGSDGSRSPGTGGGRRWGPVLGGVLVVVAAVLVIGSLDTPSDEPARSDPTFLVEPTDPVGAGLDRLTAAGPWEPAILPGSGIATAIAARGDEWMVAVNTWSGGSQLWTSTDGLTWTPIFDQSLVEARVLTLGVLDDGTWIAGGSVINEAADVSDVPFPIAMIWTSDDGGTWARRDGLPFASDPGQEVTGMAISGERVALFLGAPSFFPAPSRTDAALSVWESTDDAKTWVSVPIEGRALTLASAGGEVVIGGQLDLAPVVWRSSLDYRPIGVPSLEIGSVEALAELPDGGVLARLENALDTVWVRSGDFQVWDELPDPPLTVSGSRLESAGPVVLALPSDQTSSLAVQATEDGMEWVPLTGRSSVDVPRMAHWSEGQLVMAGSSGSNPAVWTNSPDRVSVVTPDAPGGKWEPLFGKPTGWRRISASSGRLVLGDRGSVYVWGDGRFDAIPGPPDSFDGVADQMMVTPSTIFLVDGFDVFTYREESGWEVGKAPIGFLMQAIIETGDGFVAAAIVGDRVEVSFSSDGLTWGEPRAGGVDSSFVTATEDGRLVSGPGDSLGYLASTDGRNWSPLMPNVLPSSLDAWVVDRSTSSLSVLGVAGEPVSFELPPGFIPRFAGRLEEGRLLVFGWLAGRAVLAVIGPDAIYLPAGPSNGLTSDLSDAYVTADGMFVGVDASLRVLVWRPQ